MLRRIQRRRRLLEVAAPPGPLSVTHLLEAFAGAGSGLWGKERLVEGLMLCQRESGQVAPRLIVFAPCALASVMRDHGFPVTVLEDAHRRLPIRSLPALHRAVSRGPATVLHTHGYKANLIGRVARASQLKMRGLVASCHAWFDESRATKFYNELDRRTVFLSDATTVADAGMLSKFPRSAGVRYVANGLPDRMPATAGERQAARADFAFPHGVAVAGFLARTNAAKGVPEVLEAARRSLGEPILWAIAGAGDMADAIVAAALPNVRYMGYLAASDDYRAALDLFVQASHIEGLSLSLLEAMRAGLPIVATRAGSTALALRDGVEGALVAPGDVDGLLAAVRTLAAHPGRAAAYGARARERFVSEFGIERQHLAFLDIYRACAR